MAHAMPELSLPSQLYGIIADDQYHHSTTTKLYWLVTCEQQHLEVEPTTSQSQVQRLDHYNTSHTATGRGRELRQQLPFNKRSPGKVLFDDMFCL